MNGVIARAQIVSLALFVMAGLSWGQSPDHADEDGCWATPAGCVHTESEWRGTNFRWRGTNNCGGRIYIQFCNEAPGLSAEGDCGASGLRAGQRKTWTTNGGHNPTGRSFWGWIGSNRPGMDWVCANKVQGWNDPPDYN